MSMAGAQQNMPLHTFLVFALLSMAVGLAVSGIPRQFSDEEASLLIRGSTVDFQKSNSLLNGLGAGDRNRASMPSSAPKEARPSALPSLPKDSQPTALPPPSFVPHKASSVSPISKGPPLRETMQAPFRLPILPPDQAPIMSHAEAPQGLLPAYSPMGVQMAPAHSPLLSTSVEVPRSLPTLPKGSPAAAEGRPDVVSRPTLLSAPDGSPSSSTPAPAETSFAPLVQSDLSSYLQQLISADSSGNALSPYSEDVPGGALPSNSAAASPPPQSAEAAPLSGHIPPYTGEAAPPGLTAAPQETANLTSSKSEAGAVAPVIVNNTVPEILAPPPELPAPPPVGLPQLAYPPANVAKPPIIGSPPSIPLEALSPFTSPMSPPPDHQPPATPPELPMAMPPLKPSPPQTVLISASAPELASAAPSPAPGTDLASSLANSSAKSPTTKYESVQSPAVAPSLITAFATEAASGSDAQTAVDASIQIQGPGTTPFDANNQNLVINAFAAVMTTVTRADFLVRYFTSDDSKIPTFGSSSSGRKLLAEGKATRRRLHQSELHAEPQALNSNTVFVTLQINAGANFRTQAVKADVESALSPGGPYSVVPVQQALQSYGQPNWSLKLLSMDSVDPTQPLAIELVCNKKFGSFCLDGSGLSQGAVKGIIAGGCIFLVLVSALLCVFLDICRRSGRMGELEMHPETPRTPMQKAVNSLTSYLQATIGAVRTPRRQGGRSAPTHSAPAQQTIPESSVPGSPVTATVEIAEAKGSAFGSAKPGSGSSSGIKEVKAQPAEIEPTPMTPTSRPGSRSPSRRSSRSGGSSGTAGKSNQAYGAMKEVPKPSTQLATGITPLVGGQATGTAAAVEKGTGTPGASLPRVRTSMKLKPDTQE